MTGPVIRSGTAGQDRALSEVSCRLRTPDLTGPYVKYVYPDGWPGVAECIGFS